jgi:AraC family transcriptional regulator, ethanolamine operon transcriptional activator
MNVTIDHFGDIHHHAESVREWSQTYSQLSRGSLESSLIQLSGPRFQVFRELINQRVVQHGEAPRGRICFAVPLDVAGAAWLQGREADAGCVFVLQGGEEFMFHMPMGMDMLAITFDRSVFEQAMTSAPQPDELATLLKQPVLRLPAGRLGDSRSRLLDLFQRALSVADNRPAEADHCLEEALVREMVNLFTDPECDKRQRHGSSSGSYIVEKCHRLTLEDKLNPPSVNELCQRLRVSRRTVQNGFHSVAETTPINYMRSVRLNGVRRELMTTRGAELSIGDAAGRWGFFHLSHFAADYEELFGELPSHTRRLDGSAARALARASAVT